MAKVTFTIASDAANQSIFVMDKDDPSNGTFVKLKKKDDTRVGSIELDTGQHLYLMRLKGGTPNRKWTLSVQRDTNKPVEREGALDGDGDGGEVGQITVF